MAIKTEKEREYLYLW